MFKQTPKFRRRNHINHPEVDHETIERILDDPEIVEIQDDGRVRRWGQADLFDDGELRYVRVVTLEDGETVLTAFVDGNLTRQKRRQLN